MKFKTKSVMKAVFFIAFLMLGYNGIEEILRFPKEDKWNKPGIEEIYKNKNYYDLISIGPSTVISNINYQQLFSDYGIAGKSLGDPLQPLYLSYYLLEESIKYQKPKVVLYDVRSLFYTEEDIRIQNQTHDPIDRMRNNITKYKAFKQMKELGLSTDIWEYFSEMYHSHSNWQGLGKDSFVNKEGSHMLNDYTAIFTVPENLNIEAVKLNYEDHSMAEIPEIDKKYLDKIIKLCSDNDIQFVLTKGFGNHYWNIGFDNTVKRVVEDNNIQFIDMSNYETEMNFDWQRDTADGVHHNVMGAYKWTKILGEYLCQNYEIPDRRDDDNYSKYTGEIARKNEIALDSMKSKIELMENVYFDEYLEALNKVDCNENVIIIAVNNDAANRLSQNESSKLHQLGLREDLVDKQQYSYIGIVNQDEQFELLSKDIIEKTGCFNNNIFYRIISMGGEDADQSQIMIGGNKVMNIGKGINIVVYNTTFNEVLSAVYFNTSDFENPPMERIVSGDTKEEYAIGFNQWKTIENYSY